MSLAVPAGWEIMQGGLPFYQLLLVRSASSILFLSSLNYSFFVQFGRQIISQSVGACLQKSRGSPNYSFENRPNFRIRLQQFRIALSSIHQQQCLMEGRGCLPVERPDRSDLIQIQSRASNQRTQNLSIIESIKIERQIKLGPGQRKLCHAIAILHREPTLKFYGLWVGKCFLNCHSIRLEQQGPQNSRLAFANRLLCR